MKILDPFVELWEENEEVSHVTRCARVCYGKDSGDDKHLYEALNKKNHNSMFRHHTSYYIVNMLADKIVRNLCEQLINAQFIIQSVGSVAKQFIPGYEIKRSLNNVFYIAINGNYLIDNPAIKEMLDVYEVDKEIFENDEIGKSLMRYTFAVITQISTSRELNRVSPNNIAEQSTRYVYENGAIVRPHWITDEDIKNYNNDNFQNINHTIVSYLTNCSSQFNVYKQLINLGIPKQDARGLLPLDTATKVVYTYSIREWTNIINLRYYGITGKPHPNAKIITGMIKDKLVKLGYEFK